MSNQNISLSSKDIERIATLSRLGLSDEEVTAATKNVSGILEHFSAIGHIDTTDVPPADEEHDNKNVTRGDSAEPDVLSSASALMKEVPQVEKNQIKVQSIFDSTSL